MEVGYLSALRTRNRGAGNEENTRRIRSVLVIINEIGVVLERISPRFKVLRLEQETIFVDDDSVDELAVKAGGRSGHVDPLKRSAPAASREARCGDDTS